MGERLPPTLLGRGGVGVRLLERACHPGGLTPSRYNSVTLPYTSRSTEHVYPVYAHKLLAPAVWLWSLMSIPPVFREDGLWEKWVNKG